MDILNHKLFNQEINHGKENDKYKNFHKQCHIDRKIPGKQHLFYRHGSNDIVSFCYGIHQITILTINGRPIPHIFLHLLRIYPNICDFQIFSFISIRIAHNIPIIGRNDHAAAFPYMTVSCNADHLLVYILPEPFRIVSHLYKTAVL